MLNTAKELVSQIQSSQKEIEAMNDKIFAIEMGRLHEIIDVARCSFQYSPIIEVLDEEMEIYFTNEEGNLLNGILIFHSCDFFEDTDDCNIEAGTQIYLLENGDLKVTRYIDKSYYCDDCEEDHSNFQRMDCNGLSLKEFDLELIAKRIIDLLSHQNVYLDKVKQKKHQKLQGIA
ncbi:hypothetical protein [Halalkalibacter akibai]|uniref:Uncharacterized protein n=1 Tax=Halalkalibacter akibai (strain ATCC 43226 / DSM 21942 / CIP 109018 / JCM 9157 / 1139) TaxID=1236973 RepID=W4QZU4_HALA3|nr:hypothetical protein [Halalkalibacter akibai]GAE37655.1 hypothetical protein JCM9157_4972 [Halalkalibacter akibai JCM 9157]